MLITILTDININKDIPFKDRFKDIQNIRTYRQNDHKKQFNVFTSKNNLFSSTIDTLPRNPHWLAAAAAVMAIKIMATRIIIFFLKNFDMKI